MPHLDHLEGSSLAQKALGQDAPGRERNRESHFVAAGHMVLQQSLLLASCQFFEVALAENSFRAADQGLDTSREWPSAFCHIRRIVEEVPRHMVMWSVLVPDLCRSSPRPQGLQANYMGLKDRHFAAAGAVDYILRGSVDCMCWIGGPQAFYRSSEQQ